MHYLPRALSLATFATALFSIAANAQTISDTNVFTGATATPNNEYNEAQFHKGNVNDGTAAQFFFSDTSTQSLLSLSGFTAATGISSLRFYDTDQFQVERVATQVTVYASSSSLTGADLLDVTKYVEIGSYNLPIGASGYYTGGVDSNVLASDPGFNPHGSYNSGPTYGDFDTLTGLNIASGTTNVLLDFGAARLSGAATVGQGFTEIQGFADAPEPSTYFLLIAGLVLFSLGVRRSKLRSAVRL